MQELEKLFKQHHLRLTKPRQEVFDVLARADAPLLIHQINQVVATADRTSVYRTLEIFHDLGIIEIIHTGFKKRYELAGPFAPHHHHIQCAACGKLSSIDSPRLEELLSSIAASQGYALSQHHIELQGICENCQQKSAR